MKFLTIIKKFFLNLIKYKEVSFIENLIENNPDLVIKALRKAGIAIPQVQDGTLAQTLTPMVLTYMKQNGWDGDFMTLAKSAGILLGIKTKEVR